MILFWAIVGTQIFAVLMCGFGWLVPSLPWTVIGLVWVYNFIWMIIQDAVKVGVYYLLEDRPMHKRKFIRTLNQPLHTHCGAG
jgi:H+-transporting ATPase